MPKVLRGAAMAGHPADGLPSGRDVTTISIFTRPAGQLRKQALEMRRSRFCRIRYGIYKRSRYSAVMGRAAIDFGREAEGKVQLHIGEPFQVAGQVRQISEIRNPTDPIG